MDKMLLQRRNHWPELDRVDSSRFGISRLIRATHPLLYSFQTSTGRACAVPPVHVFPRRGPHRSTAGVTAMSNNLVSAIRAPIDSLVAIQRSLYTSLKLFCLISIPNAGVKYRIGFYGLFSWYCVKNRMYRWNNFSVRELIGSPWFVIELGFNRWRVGADFRSNDYVLHETRRHQNPCVNRLIPLPNHNHPRNPAGGGDTALGIDDGHWLEYATADVIRRTWATTKQKIKLLANEHEVHK